MNRRALAFLAASMALRQPRPLIPVGMSDYTDAGRERKGPGPHVSHQGERERARRRRQLAKKQGSPE